MKRSTVPVMRTGVAATGAGGAGGAGGA
ncbi:hypothetical protein XPU_0780, partial [Xanthomonas arboricola pv. pruni str. MAFF 311562]